MVKVEMIRVSSTLDRPDFRVSAEDVFDALRALHNDDDDGKPRSFTTRDIADALADRFRGIDIDRVERSVRAGVSWLCEREVAYVAGHTVKITGAGCVSKPFLYALYPGRMWSKKEREVIRGACDYALLSRIFLTR